MAVSLAPAHHPGNLVALDAHVAQGLIIEIAQVTDRCPVAPMANHPGRYPDQQGDPGFPRHETKA